VWLAIRERLNTCDRLVLFGICDVSVSSFCGGIESHAHLFFECPYLSNIWSYLQRKLNVNWGSMPWRELPLFLSKELKGKSVGNTE
jgi:hypothetical protein